MIQKQPSAPISIIILTRNEKADLPGCLESVAWCDDLHVVDSFSLDTTIEIATSAGVRVYPKSFESFGSQRNWALDNCLFKHDWILFLDADERSTPKFEEAARCAVETAADSVAGFYCCWKMMLGDRWLRRCDAFPKWQFRLVRVGRARFTDFGHGQKEGEVDGQIGYIREPYLHYAFSKGWSAWLDRHNRYSTLEAKARLEAPVDWRRILRARGSERNKLLKPLVSRIPLWPLIRFAIDYFGRLGFLEGKEGLIYCVNVAYYELLIILKIAELRERRLNDASFQG